MRWFRKRPRPSATSQKHVKRRSKRLTFECLEERVVLSGVSAGIIFQTDQFGNPDIARISPNGTDLVRLTDNAAPDVLPDATRDGSKIVFASLRDGNYEIYLMNGDGTGQKRLTTDAAVDYDPSISPDGSRIAFLSTRSGNYDIWMMNADGSGLKNLTANSSAADLSPSWSADGTKLLFTSYRDGNENIYGMNADGTGQTRLTDNPARDSNPVFSPDGTKIAFQSEPDGNREIYVMNANGSGQVRLTNDPGADQSPYFSPDGTLIAFATSRAGNSELYRMKLDGTKMVRITNSTAYETIPVWVGPATPLPTLAISDASVVEGNAGTTYATFKVTLSSASGAPVTVKYTTSNGTAAAGSDYGATAGVLTFAPGMLTQTIAVPIYGDTLVEPNETFNVFLYSSVNATMADGRSDATIVNDDVAARGQLQFYTGTFSVNEGTPTATIYVTRKEGSSGAVSVQYSAGNGTAAAPGDFTAVSGVLSWADGDTGLKSFTVPIVNDNLYEGNETVLLTLSNPTGGATLGSLSSATLAIVDNDPATSSGRIQFGAAQHSVNEGAGIATITVTRAEGSAGAVSVQYSAGNGTATAPGDFAAVSGVLSWAAGETAAKTFTVPIVNDNLYEGNETVLLKLVSPSGGATLGSQASATLTIIDDDPQLSAGRLQLTSANYSIAESATTALIGVTRLDGSSGAVTVHYATSNGTATAGSDFTATEGTLSWAAGETGMKTFTVPIHNDTTVEGNEALGLALTAPTGGATLGIPSTATLTIVDDDSGPPEEPEGLIYFESDRDGGFRHIFSMNPDGTNITQLTFGPYNDAIPEASEDGTKIVFASDRSNPGGIDLDIYMVNWDGTGLTHVSNMAGQEYDPSISHDKKFIVFQGAGVGGTTDLYLYDVQNQTTRNLTNDSATQSNSAWASDSHRLLYTTNVGGSDEIFIMTFDVNMNVVSKNQLTFDSTSRDFYPDISYFGDRIAWAKATATDTDLYMADLVKNGADYSLANIKNVTQSPTTAESMPYFSPDESDWLSFVSNRDVANSAEVYKVHIPTGTVERMTSDTFRDLYPTWVETPLVIAISDVTVAEGNPDSNSQWTSMVFTVTLSRELEEAYKVNFATADGTAIAGTDYQATSGTLTFAPDVTSLTITVLVRKDTVTGPNRNFFVKLSKTNPQGEFKPGVAVGTILDDDVA